MLYVKREFFALTETGNPEDLKVCLQNAIAGHATMPPYLYLVFVGWPSSNREIKSPAHDRGGGDAAHAVGQQPLKAIGGRSVIHSASFVPSYPGPLPGIAADLKCHSLFSRATGPDVFRAN
jgi:hypothetical protein